jgi:hypothetical protein
VGSTPPENLKGKRNRFAIRYLMDAAGPTGIPRAAPTRQTAPSNGSACAAPGLGRGRGAKAAPDRDRQRFRTCREVRGNASLLTLQCEGPKGPGITGFPPLSGLRLIPGPCVETTPEAWGRGVGASPARGAERKAQGARRTTPARRRPAPRQPSCRPAMAMNADFAAIQKRRAKRQLLTGAVI